MASTCGQCAHARPNCDELACSRREGCGEWITWSGGETCASFTAKADEVAELKAKLREERKRVKKLRARNRELRERLAEAMPERADEQMADAAYATLPYAKTVWRSVAQLYHVNPTEAFGKMHSGMAAAYMLAYEAGTVHGLAGDAR